MKQNLKRVLCSVVALIAISIFTLSANAQSSAGVKGFDIKTILTKDGYGDETGYSFKSNMVSQLKNLGFTLSSSVKSKLYTSEGSSCRAKKDTYKKNGIQVVYTHTTSQSCQITEVMVIFPDNTTMNNFLNSAQNFGYSSNGGSYYEVSSGWGPSIIKEGKKVTIKYES